MTDQITLVSSEGTKFQTSSKISQLSGLIERILQDYNINEEIPLRSVCSLNLQRIIDYSSHHNFSPPIRPKKPVVSNQLRDNFTDEWDAQFIESIPESELIDLISASNYLDMKSLLDTCLVKIACSFKDKSVEEIEKEYDIQEHFTPEVEEKLKQEYSWAMEVEPEEN